MQHRDLKRGINMFKKIIEAIKNRKLRKKEKTELVAMIKDLNQQVKTQIDKAVLKIEELSQEKLYFLYADVDNEEELTMIKQQFSLIKRSMNWTVPNMLILNRPLIELSEKKLKELEETRKKLKRGAK